MSHSDRAGPGSHVAELAAVLAALVLVAILIDVLAPLVILYVVIDHVLSD